MRRISVIGLGYVGLPLCVAIAKKAKVFGFDVDEDRISELKNNYDRTFEIDQQHLQLVSGNMVFSTKESVLDDVDTYIVTVPTPVDEFNTPDLKAIITATNTIAKYLKPNDLVIYESTVYPGLTEEICIPILENVSKLNINNDFGVGYSPERINPGDKDRKISDITKIVSGSNHKWTREVENIYKPIISAGVHVASSIRVAEAAKVIENTQRDVNIALMNELAILFEKLKINTADVLDAAATKWNFMNFSPGLVGGHCIGVDPYYLVHKSKEIGYLPEIITAGRRINDHMPHHVVNKLIRSFFMQGGHKHKLNVLILGATFKENCPDLRNSKVFVMFQELRSMGVNVDVHDPVADNKELSAVYTTSAVKEIIPGRYNAAIIAVAHKHFIDLGISRIEESLIEEKIIFDVKSIFRDYPKSLKL